jgi:hypothetical protein
MNIGYLETLKNVKGSNKKILGREIKEGRLKGAIVYDASDDFDDFDYS